MNDTASSATPPKFLLLLTSYQSSLYAAIAAMLGGVEGAHDVLQDTNLVLLAKAAEYDESRPFLPWAVAFARFQVMAWRKRQTRDRLVLDDELLAAVADRLSDRPLAPSAALDALERCLGKLSADARSMVDARYREDEAVTDIAARQGMSVNAVSVTLFRIRKTLRDCIQATLAGAGGG